MSVERLAAIMGSIRSSPSLAVVLLCLSVSLFPCIHALFPRESRIWPVGGTTTPDLPQSSPYGPRLKVRS